ncbi:MAG: hypothetical protein COY58_02410 [Gammaproteobacteria bacterium CG_4_10_14_0_8_um_filter_38_16]|nr:MAG: hypothetical protein COY58_02410 [Gammaproteobacteria bacterium CG_4_10_14_0_8_um_filter_38_16]PJA03788.1 MAG: hypothetical protein COX72_02570 [Gammaproteobacteria bacterium CG_4_10_14_0_2_um_filter_38_22]PJB10399.1 MAG: hypothetical protein CO120_05115 [Gammaproteobacteria bacterium CG_4_9_14_3_um_filter_38_9]
MMTAMQNTTDIPADLKPAMDALSRSSLGNIIQKAKWLLALDRYVKTILPASFASFCHVMNVDQSNLVLGVSNAAVATRIRFMSDTFLRTLQQKKEFAHIRTVHCRICAKTVQY